MCSLGEARASGESWEPISQAPAPVIPTPSPFSVSPPSAASACDVEAWSPRFSSPFSQPGQVFVSSGPPDTPSSSLSPTHTQTLPRRQKQRDHPSPPLSFSQSLAPC